jgi:hypothetical protein
MTHKILTPLVLVLSLSVFAVSNVSAQDAHADSSFSKLNLGKKLFKKLVTDKSHLEFNDLDTEKDNSNTDNTDTYGIGNVIGKKKSGKANKKAGRSIKVEINLAKTKVLQFEIQVDKGNFSITRELITD